MLDGGELVTCPLVTPVPCGVRHPAPAVQVAHSSRDGCPRCRWIVNAPTRLCRPAVHRVPSILQTRLLGFFAWVLACGPSSAGHGPLARGALRGVGPPMIPTEGSVCPAFWWCALIWCRMVDSGLYYQSGVRVLRRFPKLVGLPLRVRPSGVVSDHRPCLDRERKGWLWLTGRCARATLRGCQGSWVLPSRFQKGGGDQ